MLLWRGIQGASKNLLGSLQLHGVLEIWPPKVSILMENLRDGWPKIAISRDFWHFSNFDVFLKGEPRGIQKPKRDLPNSCATREMAAGSFNFIGKHEGEPNKNRNFLKFRFSESLKAQNGSQRGPLPGHLIGPFLSEGFTSGLRPLPTCYTWGDLIRRLILPMDINTENHKIQF